MSVSIIGGKIFVYAYESAVVDTCPICLKLHSVLSVCYTNRFDCNTASPHYFQSITKAIF